MSWIHRLLSNLKRLFGRSRFEKNMDQEIRVHFEMEREANRRRGLSPQDALEATRRGFGSVERYKEECRDTLGVRMFHDFTDDVRYGLRQLMKFPGLSSVLLVTVAFCIGANVAVFSLVHAVWLKPYSYPDLDRVVNLGMLWPKSGPRGQSSRDFDTQLSRNQRSIHLVRGAGISLRGKSRPASWRPRDADCLREGNAGHLECCPGSAAHGPRFYRGRSQCRKR